DRQAFDSPDGSRDPVCKLSRLNHAAHQRLDIGVVGGTGQPAARLAIPFLSRQHPSIGTDGMAGEISDLPVKSKVRQREAERDSELLGNTVPAVQAGLNLADIVV